MRVEPASELFWFIPENGKLRTQADTELAQTRLFQIGPMLRSVFIAGTIIYWVACSSALAQGTIQFGFEEYNEGATVPFANSILSRFPPTVSDGTSSGIQPFEGRKLLFASGYISLQSPDGLPIQSFTLHAFIPAPGNTVHFNIGNHSVGVFGSWQTVQESFSSPAQVLAISALDMEANPAVFAIDSVEFVTIPEPQTVWLLGIAFGAIVLGSRLKRLKTCHG
jgi:hypothetical protein